jgi:hypothetical protein
VAGQGTTTVNFGAFPGASDASVAVTGQAGILANSLAEAWIFPVATADHSADEHWVETIDCWAMTVVAGTGFTITARNMSQLNEPVAPPQGIGSHNKTLAGAGGSGGGAAGGAGTRLYGQFTVAWCWN